MVLAGRVLGPAAYADFYACLSLVFLFATGLAPVSGSITRFTSLYLARGEEDRLRSLYDAMPRRVGRYAVWIGIVGILAVYPLVRWLQLDSLWSGLLVALILPVTLMLDLPRGMLRGLQAFRAYAVNLVQEASIRLALGALLLVALPRTEVGLGVYLVAALAMLPISRRQVRLPAASGDRRADIAALERTMLPMLAFAFVAAGLQNVDILFVKSTFEPVAAGQYAAASALARIVALAFMPFSIKLLPVLTTAYSRDRRLLRPLAAHAAGFVTLAAVVVIVYAGWGETILQRVYGETFAGAGELLLPLSLAITVAFLVVMIGQAFTAMNQFHFVPFYAAGLLLVGAGLWWQRGSLPMLAWTLLATQVLTLIMMLSLLLKATSAERASREAG